MPKALSLAQRRLLAKKAAKRAGVPASLYKNSSDEELIECAREKSPAEEAAAQSLRDIPSEEFCRPYLSMEESLSEVNRPAPPFQISLLRFASKDTRTATERALGLPGRDVLAEAMAALNGADASNDMTELPNWISLAEQIAREAHQGQFRKDGITPYITHPAQIAASVPDDLKPIAWLHDVIEDTNLALAHLEAAGLPPYVLVAVHALTKVDGEDYDKYLQRVRSNDHARLVKIADIENNLKGQPSEKARAKYLLALPVLRGVSDTLSQ